MSKTKVFVYGTLKRGNSRRGLDRWGTGTQFVGDAHTIDNYYSLWDLGAFPAVALAGDSRISGEVWTVDKDTLKDLDRIEGYPDFYKRTEVNTSEGKAWMYYIPDIENYRAELIKPDHTMTSSWREQ